MSLAIATRDGRATALLARRDQWFPVFGPHGQPLGWGVPSQNRPGTYYLATHEACTCPDARHGRWCKHSRAVYVYVMNFAATVAQAS